MLVVALIMVFSGCLVAPGAPRDRAETAPLPTSIPPVPHVVVATFDTGANPWHPCFRRENLTVGPDQIPGFPSDARMLELTFGSDYQASRTASLGAINAIEDRVLYHVRNTSLAFYGENSGSYAAKDQFVDYYPHGSQASSQIGCAQFGMAPEALLVILNWYRGPQQALIRWAAEQEWIDVIHLNIQDYPVPVPSEKDAAIEYAIRKGKFVVIAAGNGVAGQGANYPMELSRYNGPPGSLIAGANDNGGYTAFSNMDPHVVMDGGSTRAANPRSFGEATFGGTSSASPRITGYVAHLLYLVRSHFHYTGGSQGDALIVLEEGLRPTGGPLSDGRLTVAELHEVVRRTANPNPHESKYDGDRSIWWVPQPVDTPVSVYAKMGYGEVSEHTIGNAFNVTIGAAAMPSRTEDAFYERSEAARRALWG